MHNAQAVRHITDFMSKFIAYSGKVLPDDVYKKLKELRREETGELATAIYDTMFENQALAKKLDRPLAAFLQIYKPAYYERVGLRYINAFSRKDLDLEGVPFRELIQPCYLGILGEEDVNETAASRCSLDVEMALRGGCRVKLHAGPGMVKRAGQEDKEVRFILDNDLFMTGNVPINLSAGAMQTLHQQAGSLFQGAVTQRLYDALEPMELL